MSRPMKDSGVEWIGEIPVDWEVVQLGRIGEFSSSGIDKKINEDEVLVKIVNYVDVYRNKSMILDSYIDYMQVTCNKEKRDKNLLGVGDIIFTPSSETIEEIGISSVVYETVENLAFSYHVLRFIPFVELDLTFKKYMTNNHLVYNYFSSRAVGTIRKTLNRKDFQLTPVIIPPIMDQEKIAIYLDRKVNLIDNILSKTRESIEEYKKYKQSLITETVTKGLNSNVKMKDSGVEWIGEIPEHWEAVNPKRLFSQRKEKARLNDQQLTASQKHGVLYQEDFMNLENQKVVLVEKDFSILKHVEPGDFVISMRSFQGGLEYSEFEGCISSAYVMVIPNESVYAPFYKWFFKSMKYINALQSTSNLVRDGQAMRFSNFAQINILDIPYDEQIEIASFLNTKTQEIDAFIQQKEQLISELESYKKSLIYEVVTGKKEV